MMVKNGDFGVVCRNVSVKLLLVEVPLDAVEVIAFEIVVTFENGLVPFQSMRRDHGVRQKLHTDTTCKVEWRKKVTLTSIMSCREKLFIFFSLSARNPAINSSSKEGEPFTRNFLSFSLYGLINRKASLIKVKIKILFHLQ